MNEDQMITFLLASLVFFVVFISALTAFFTEKPTPVKVKSRKHLTLFRGGKK